MADPIQPCWFTRAEDVEAVLVDDGTDQDALATWAAHPYEGRHGTSGRVHQVHMYTEGIHVSTVSFDLGDVLAKVAGTVEVWDAAGFYDRHRTTPWWFISGFFSRCTTGRRG